MKKVIALVVLLQSFVAFSQVSFNPGIRAGINISNFTGGSGSYRYHYGSGESDEFSPIADVYLGFQANIRLARKYALQPEFNYSRQGAVVTFTENGIRQTERLEASYFGISLVNKFYVDRLNFQIAPTFETLIGQVNFSNDVPLDLGILAGVGYDINKNIGVEARVKKGFIPVLSASGSDYSNFTVQIGAHYTFK